MLYLSLYLIGFAIAFFFQWHQPEGPGTSGGEFAAALAVGIIWPIALLVIVFRYLATLAGYNP
jgi:hypothetical protein